MLKIEQHVQATYLIFMTLVTCMDTKTNSVPLCASNEEKLIFYWMIETVNEVIQPISTL